MPVTVPHELRAAEVCEPELVVRNLSQHHSACHGKLNSTPSAAAHKRQDAFERKRVRKIFPLRKLSGDVLDGAVIWCRYAMQAAEHDDLDI